jgi:tRNA(fMet)-specific endonuclease VapC
MRYLFDTNAFICLLGQKSDRLVRRIFACAEGEIGLSHIVLHELYHGAYRSQRVEANLETLRLLAQDFPLVEFDREMAQHAGEIRAKLVTLGMPIGPFDTMIAAQAKARNLAVVTDNIEAFQRVDGLRVEDWTAMD